jgi:hypothetical protein
MKLQMFLSVMYFSTGSVVVRLMATDEDSPYTPNGQVQYRLDGGCQDQFVIRTINGVGEVAIAPGTTLTVGTCTIRVSHLNVIKLTIILFIVVKIQSIFIKAQVFEHISI